MGEERQRQAPAREAAGGDLDGDPCLPGQQTVAALSGSEASVLAEARISVTEESGRLLVSVEDPKTLQLLLSDRPRRAFFKVELSGEKGATPEVRVEYDP